VKHSSDPNRDILNEQIAYYRARASEYDQTVLGSSLDPAGGRRDQFPGGLAEARDLLSQQGPFHNALELACGTGIWTEVLTTIADNITVIDAAPEMLAIVRQKLGDDRITYRQADLLSWQPDEQHDLVFFAFWLSHVPPEALDSMLANAARALAPGGRLIIIDQYAPTPADSRIARGEIYAERPLLDGRIFTIVKVFYTLDYLRDKLSQLGLQADAQELGASFFFLTAQAVTPSS
jgi:ubiquinone/menaquinone biosynthesis C-methylase UbiE